MNKNNCVLTVLILLIMSIGMSGCVDEQADGDAFSATGINRDLLFQTSTIDALLEGVYDGDITFEEMKEHGDFGIGTFNGLDGEMIAIDGDVYQIRADGIAYTVNDSMMTPFAAVTYFDVDEDIVINESMSQQQLEEYLVSLMPSKNIIYAFRIDGTFDHMKTRSVPKQNKPYPRLVEVAKNQPTFEFNDTEGTVIGFWLPEYIDGINVPGYHFHFITEDRTAGGHVLEFDLRNANVQIDQTYDFMLELPRNDDFSSVDLTDNKQDELKQVEK
ncbi:acetolactate decarboxylase [Methanolobus sp. ZRKC3]|uniref:acetolactate decarboxylase n=1 Tax=Methanolobus sp. ZRKC3 TaxID=3125786 RepID=UPI003243057C